MQKVPILPTQPWQDGAPVLSTPTAAPAAPSTFGLHVYTAQAKRSRLGRLRVHSPVIVSPTIGNRARQKPVIVVKPVRVAKRAKLRRHKLLLSRPVLIARALGQVRTGIVKNRARALVRLRPAIILRPPWTGVPRAKTVKAIFLRSQVKPIRSQRRRHRALVVRPGLTTTRGRAFVRTIFGQERQRALAERHFAIIVRPKPAPTVVVTQETLKHVYVKSRVAARRIIAAAAAHRSVAIVLRPPWTGVPRSKTVKPVFTRSLKSIPRAKLRRHRSLILRPRPLFMRPLRAFVHGAIRPQRQELRKHAPRILRSQPWYARPKRPLLHQVPSAKRCELRKHRPFTPPSPAPRSRPTRAPRPIIARPDPARSALRRRHRAFLPRLVPFTGVVVYPPNIDYYDHPVGYGVMSSAPRESDYDASSSSGNMSSSPREDRFQSNPIGEMDASDRA